MARRPPAFKSRSDALCAIKRMHYLAEHGISALEAEFRTKAPHIRTDIKRTRRGLRKLALSMRARRVR